MRKFLFSLMALFMASTAMAAGSFLYMDDQVVTPGQRITVPVKASFDGRVSGFQLDLTFPEGITPVNAAQGADQTVSYLDYDGDQQTQTASYGQNQAVTRMMAVLSAFGYWDPDGDGEYEKYGVIKWEAGNYDKMIMLTMDVAEGFQGGEIVLETQVAAGSDTRGGTVIDLGEGGVTFTQVCNVTVVELEETPMPDIFVTQGDDVYTVIAEGEDEVHLYIDGMEVENPYMIERTSEDREYTANATAQGDGKLISQMAEVTFTVLAKEVQPQPVDDDYLLTMDDAEVLHGRTVVIPVSMTNAAPVTAFQADLYLPEGFELQNIELSDRKGDHELSFNTREDGSVRILCYSNSLLPFTGNEGELFYITVKTPANVVADEGVNYAEYHLNLRNILLTNNAWEEIHCEDAVNTVKVLAYLRGDANGDGVVDVSDVVATARYILGYNPNPFVFEAADMTGDGNITVTDAVQIINEVLNPNNIDLMRAPAVGENNDAMSGEDFIIGVGETRTVAIALDNDMDYTAFQLDMELPAGLTATNFRMTDRAGSHAVDASMVDGKLRVMCYSPVLAAIDGHEGALLAFDVTATGAVSGDVAIDAIEMVNTNCQTVYLEGFAMRVNADGTTSVKELTGDLRIYSDGKNIVIESPIAQSVLISDVAGRAYSVDVTEGRNVIPARNSGVVIVKAGDKTAKLMME